MRSTAKDYLSIVIELREVIRILEKYEQDAPAVVGTVVGILKARLLSAIRLWQDQFVAGEE